MSTSGIGGGVFFAVLFFLNGCASRPPSGADASVPAEKRAWVEATLARLTLEERIGQMIMSKAFGYAGLRVGYAVAAPATAAVLEARRAPAPIASPAARIAAAALRDPRYDVASEIEERERVRTALGAAGFDAPPGRRQLRLDPKRRRSR